MVNRPKRGSGERSNWYSGSKFTNWTPYDPYSSELRACTTDRRPAAVVKSDGPTSRVPIFADAPHHAFLHACTPADVHRVLSACPKKFLVGLEAVFILSGSTKQARALRLFRYGCYSADRIFLHAYPKSMLSQHHGTPPAPHVRRLYERFGARVSESAGRWTLQFDESSLRRFYLYDVLLHELGHHIDERVDSRPSPDSERFAEWFAEEQARQLGTRSAG